MSDFKKCKKELLSKGRFYSLLTDRKTKGEERKTKDEEYEHVVNVWKWKKYEGLSRLIFKICCFIIRNDSLRNYGLSASHYLRAPGLSWDGMLKITKIELELIPETEVYIFFDKGTKGRISNRYSKSNKDSNYYEPKQESKHIIQLDANNSHR